MLITILATDGSLMPNNGSNGISILDTNGALMPYTAANSVTFTKPDGSLQPNDGVVPSYSILGTDGALNPYNVSITKSALSPTGGAYSRLGPELVSNPTFASATGWTAGVGWSVSGGLGVRAAGAGSSGIITTPVSLIVGASYLVEFDVVSQSGGSTVQARFQGGTQAVGPNKTTLGRYSTILVATTGNNVAGPTEATSAGGCTVDNFSVRQLL